MLCGQSAVGVSEGQDTDGGKNNRNACVGNGKALTAMIFSTPERNISLWNLFAECSSSGGNLISAARVPRALMSLKCEVCECISFL